jgi:hypothetical protein
MVVDVARHVGSAVLSAVVVAVGIRGADGGRAERGGNGNGDLAPAEPKSHRKASPGGFNQADCGAILLLQLYGADVKIS